MSIQDIFLYTTCQHWYDLGTLQLHETSTYIIPILYMQHLLYIVIFAVMTVIRTHSNDMHNQSIAKHNIVHLLVYSTIMIINYKTHLIWSHKSDKSTKVVSQKMHNNIILYKSGTKPFWIHANISPLLYPPPAFTYFNYHYPYSPITPNLLNSFSLHTVIDVVILSGVTSQPACWIHLEYTMKSHNTIFHPRHRNIWYCIYTLQKLINSTKLDLNSKPKPFSFNVMKQLITTFIYILE